MKNGCPQCEQLPDDEICDNCYLGMLEAEHESIQNRIVEVQGKIGNKIASITYWDIECSKCMSKVEYFKGKQ